MTDHGDCVNRLTAGSSWMVFQYGCFPAGAHQWHHCENLMSRQHSRDGYRLLSSRGM